jgi:hypothetical protein
VSSSRWTQDVSLVEDRCQVRFENALALQTWHLPEEHILHYTQGFFANIPHFSDHFLVGGISAVTDGTLLTVAVWQQCSCLALDNLPRGDFRESNRALRQQY